MLRSIPILLSLCVLSGCAASNNDSYHTLRVEFRMFANATAELLGDEIGRNKDWRGDVHDLISLIEKNEYWSEKLVEGELFTSGGKDLWGNIVSVYRHDKNKVQWVIVESAGPDGDMATQDDNISSRFALSP